MKFRVEMTLEGNSWDDVCDALAQSTNDIIDGRVAGKRTADQASCTYRVESFCGEGPEGSDPAGFDLPEP